MTHKTFFIGDTHFGHKNIITFEPIERPYNTIEEHNRDLIAKWNAVVRPQDKVFHIGDYAFGRDNIAIGKKLNGRKVLVMGNHDHYLAELYLEVFDKYLFGAIGWHDCILTHIPIHPACMDRYKYNIHGHLHSKTIQDYRYINVSCEKVGCTPRTFDELLERQRISP